MNRLFEEHKVRRVLPLDGIWDFQAADSSVTSMAVPGCWESNPLLASYRGEAVYRKRVELGGNIRLVFEGVSHTARVSLDGVSLGEHYGAYGAFAFVVKGLEEKIHRLKVLVDNSFHEDSALHIPNDYYSYGGLTRPVRAEFLKSVYIRRMHVTPWKNNITREWQAEADVELENLESEEKTVRLLFELADQSVMQELTLAAGEVRTVTFDLTCQEARNYEPAGEKGASPVLYQAQAVLYEGKDAIDDLIDRVGFREIKISGRDILWNGRKLLLKGFNRHEDYGDFGCAVPLQAMYRDIELIKAAGANCIRTCHYPNDPRFLDLCDENGILVWEEAHARGLSEERMRHPLFMEQSVCSIREMIGQHYNHPCIFVWGLLNECASYTDYGYDCYEKLIAQIRQLDASRPVTFASCHPGKDKCLGLADIVSFNIYPGWYLKESTKETLEHLKAFIATTKGAGKPLIISEIGAGAVYGFRSCNEEKWTEEYQAKTLSEQIAGVLEDADCSGLFIWQFADCRVDPEWFSSRPKTQNNKGVVDIYRREKLSYRAVRDAYKAK